MKNKIIKGERTMAIIKVAFEFWETCVLGPSFIKYMIFKPQLYEIWKSIINRQNNMKIVHFVLSQFYLPKLPPMSFALAAK